MNIIVTCSDHHRRVAQVDQKPGVQPVAATVKIAATGRIVKGFARATEGLEFIFTEGGPK